MGLIHWGITHIAPILYVRWVPFLSKCTDYVASIVTSPVTSYADQIYSIHRTRSSAGFSLDIPLIMLVASILKYIPLPFPVPSSSSRY